MRPLRSVVDDVYGVTIVEITGDVAGTREVVQGEDGAVFEARNGDGSGEAVGGRVGEESAVGACFSVAACVASASITCILRNVWGGDVPLRPVAPEQACRASSRTTFPVGFEPLSRL